MTTQNTHSEHSDVEESVVGYSPVSETETETETSPSLPTSAVSAPANETPPDTVPGEQEAQSPATTRNDQQEEHNPNPNLAPQEAQTIADFAPVETQEPSTAMEAQEPKPEITSFPYDTASSLVSEEDVRPFTDFIEEFRQAETRFGSALQSYRTDQLTSTESAVPPMIDQAQPTAPIESESAAVKSKPTLPVERPVSPLLRPATPRQRTPRHGGRHREETHVEKSEPEQAPIAPSVPEPAPAITESAPAQVEEQPRPARRYRFDRPAPAVTAPVTPTTPTASTSTPPDQLRAEENKDVSGRSSTALPVRPENGYVPDGEIGEKEAAPLQQTKQVSAVTLPSENTPSKQPEAQAQETAAAGNSAAATTTAAPDHSRRRHGQEHQRAKAQATPATTPASVVAPAEIAKEVAEPVVPNKDEVSPEDLPPLEYAELQKASSRRRRRRHSSGQSNATVTPLPAATPEAPIAPTPAPAPPVAMPRTPTPTQPAAPSSQFTLTSGFTVNQMNQSRDGSNPFMGPDPSPARGTMGAQNVRSIRTDVQRTPSYPVRTTEATSASVHQLANVVSQAIQTQTDRMIAELRRANQSPTNVSVSLPPFPSTERVGVFVDVANLLYSARTLRITVNFGKLLDFLRGNRRLIRAHAYCPTSPQPGDEQMFLQAVKGLGYRITTKNYKTFSSGAKKADLDLDLCMDVVRLVDGKAVDGIVLVSGDSDFMPMLDYCSDHGVRVEVAAFDEAMSATLRQSCDLFINLSMLEEIRA